MSPRLREKQRLREHRLLGIRTGIPEYIPAILETRGFKLKFYDLSDVKIGEIGSEVKEGRVSNIEFELLDLGCGAFSFVIDEMPQIISYVSDLLENGDFETSDVGVSPAGWTAGNSALITTQAGGKSGKCMRIVENGTANPYAYQDIMVTPSFKYELIGFIKAGTEATYRIKIKDKTDSFAILYDSEDQEETAGDWSTEGGAVVTAPVDCVEIRIELYQVCAQSAGTSIFFDECTFKEGEYVDAFTIGYRTRVDIHPYFDETAWFTGFIQTLPQPGKKKPYEYSGFGFYDQLDWMTVTGSYTNDEISVIVKDIIQNTVAPNTQIIYNASKVEVTTYTAISIDFDHVSAKDAIQSLADMAQGWEFGVDNSREFYFRAISTTVNHSFWIGKHFQEIEINENPFTVRNKLYIKMGEIQEGGSNIIGFVQDATSISTYGLREEIITAPEALVSADATQWGSQILAEKKDPQITAKLTNLLMDTTKTKIDATGKVRVTIRGGAEYELVIDKVSYFITPAGILAAMELR